MQKFLMAVLAAAALAGCDEAVKVSSFGYDPEDSTKFIQAALDSGVRKLVLDRQAGPWYTLPLKMRSNTELVLEPGVELVAKRGEYKGIRDYLLELRYVTNVVIRGGNGSALRMWKTDYQGPDYKHGEWRYALRIFHSVNVLVEGLRICDSGGDGIGVTGENITIRNCVCDNNHRQGISVFNVRGLLIEDTVLSNTKGTPPEAGIDFEPDGPKEGLENVVMRNCLSIGNHGRGFEFYLNNMNARSPRMSVTLENCRSVGNSNSVMVFGSKKAMDHVTGNVRFVNCSFENASRAALYLTGVPDTALDVAFENCVISNAAANTALADVTLSAAKFGLGVPDGVRFDGLKIFQPVAREWFSYAPQGCGGPSRRIGGDVTVVTPDGRTVRTPLDAKWVAANLPAVNGGKPLPPRMGLPDAASVVAVDAKPGEMVDLASCTLISGARLVFFAEKPGKVRFIGRQVIAVKGRKPETKRMTVTALGRGGKPGRTWSLARPDDKSTEVVFDAPAAGFYALDVPAGGTRFMLEKSSVPVAIDVRKSAYNVAAYAGRPFSLFVESQGKGPFSILAGGDNYYRFNVAVRDPSGKTAAARESVTNAFVHTAERTPAGGLWRVDFSRGPQPNYDWVTLDLYGVPGAVFLSKDKTWKVR